MKLPLSLAVLSDAVKYEDVRKDQQADYMRDNDGLCALEDPVSEPNA